MNYQGHLGAQAVTQASRLLLSCKMTKFQSLNMSFKFNTHYKKVELQTALNFVYWLIIKPNKKEIFWANLFHEVFV